MSLNRCNFCTLADARKLAERTGQVVSVVPTPHRLMGGYDIHMHKRDELPAQNNWMFWLMGIGKECSCGE